MLHFALPAKSRQLHPFPFMRTKTHSSWVTNHFRALLRWSQNQNFSTHRDFRVRCSVFFRSCLCRCVCDLSLQQQMTLLLRIFYFLFCCSIVWIFSFGGLFVCTSYLICVSRCLWWNLNEILLALWISSTKNEVTQPLILNFLIHETKQSYRSRSFSFQLYLAGALSTCKFPLIYRRNRGRI